MQAELYCMENNANKYMRAYSLNSFPMLSTILVLVSVLLVSMLYRFLVASI